MSDIRDEVRKKYAKAIRDAGVSCCGGKGNCCDPITSGNYDPRELTELLDGVETASFGCGNPTALAGIREGEAVLDLGSGAGLDVFLAALKVGPSGQVYGLDMTDEMLLEAETNRQKAALENVTFLKGVMEAIPLPDESVDLIISNCVVNLSPDKDQVLREAFRVLRPGGRIALSDIVLLRPLPPAVKASVAAWTGCIAGALEAGEFRSKAEAAGFSSVDLSITKTYVFTADESARLFPDLGPQERILADGAAASALVTATKERR